MAAGSRQQSRFIAMMQNYARNTELVGIAENATGAATEQFNKTLESLDAKLNQLQTQWQSFTTTIFDQSLIKFAIDSATNLLKIINTLTGNSGLLKIGAFVGTFALLKKGVEAANKPLVQLTEHFKALTIINKGQNGIGVSLEEFKKANQFLQSEVTLRQRIYNLTHPQQVMEEKIAAIHAQNVALIQSTAASKAKELMNITSETELNKILTQENISQATQERIKLYYKNDKINADTRELVINRLLSFEYGQQTREMEKQNALDAIANQAGLLGIAHRFLLKQLQQDDNALKAIGVGEQQIANAN